MDFECYQRVFQSSNSDPKVMNRVGIGGFRGSVRLKCQAINQSANLLNRLREFIQTASPYTVGHCYRIVTLRTVFCKCEALGRTGAKQ